MKGRIAIACIALFVAGPALAGADPISQLADQTGLSERKVRMIVGARTAYAEYRYTYDRSLAKFKAGIGEENYQRLISGESITVQGKDGVQVRIASLHGAEPAS